MTKKQTKVLFSCIAIVRRVWMTGGGMKADESRARVTAAPNTRAIVMPSRGDSTNNNNRVARSAPVRKTPCAAFITFPHPHILALSYIPLFATCLFVGLRQGHHLSVVEDQFVDFHVITFLTEIPMRCPDQVQRKVVVCGDGACGSSLSSYFSVQ